MGAVRLPPFRRPAVQLPNRYPVGLPVLLRETSRRVQACNQTRTHLRLALAPPARLPFAKSKASAF